MKVTVKAFGRLQKLVGEKQFLIDVPDKSTLNDLITGIGEAFGKETEAEFRPGESARFPLMISIGNTDHRFSGGMNTPLHDGDIVYFMPPAVGG
jgi:molybdopterin converting factor small subunit